MGVLRRTAEGRRDDAHLVRWSAPVDAEPGSRVLQHLLVQVRDLEPQGVRAWLPATLAARLAVLPGARLPVRLDRHGRVLRVDEPELELRLRGRGAGLGGDVQLLTGVPPDLGP